MSKLIGFNYGSSFNTFQTTTTNSTTSTSLVALGSIFIPKNTFNNLACPRCSSFFDKVNSINGYGIRFYWNTTPNLSGSPVLFGFVSGTTAAASTYGLMRTLMINTTSGSNNVYCYNTSTSLVNDLNPPTVAPSTVTIDFTIDGYVIFAARVLNSSDTMNFRWGKISNG